VADEQVKPSEQVVETEPSDRAAQETFVDILIRIELANEPDGGVYEALEEWMQAKQWLTTLTASNGQVFPLPDATFSGSVVDPLDEVANEIHAGIVNEVWSDGALVLVTELSGWYLAGEL
jgi:hypothetical protein